MGTCSGLRTSAVVLENIAVFSSEAKARYKHAAEGLQQARQYAEMLGLKFAYATNGEGIIEVDYNTGAERAIADAAEVIVVVKPWWHTVHAAERLIEPVKLRGKHNMRLVINHMRPEKRRRRDGMLNANEILEIMQLDLLSIVPEDDYVAAFSRRGEFAALNPGSPAGQEYQNVARRLLGEEVPFMMFKS